MLGARGAGSDVGQVDLCLHHRGKFDLGLFTRLLQSLQGLAVFAQVNPLIFSELVGHVVNDTLVPVIASQESVTVGRFHLKDTAPDVEDGDVKSATTQVKDSNSLVLPLLVEAVGQRRCGRLIDDTQHLQPGDPASVLGRLALAVVKVGRDSDDRLGDLLPQVGFGVGLDLLQDHGRNFRRAVLFIPHPDSHVPVGGRCDFVGHDL